MVPLEPYLASANSVTWSPNGLELIVVGKMGPDGDWKLLRYSSGGKLIEEIPLEEMPLSAQRVGKTLLVKLGDIYVWYDERFQQIDAKDLLQSQDGITLNREYQGLQVGRHFFVLGDVKEVNSSLPGYGADEETQLWERGIVHVPVDSPRDFAVVRPLPKDLSRLYLLGYPHLAGVGGRAYFLEMKEGPEIICLARQKWRCSAFFLRLKGFDRTPVFAQPSLAAAYADFESSTLIVGIYGWRGSLYVLSKCATAGEDPTRWFLTRIDLDKGTALYTLAVPASAPHLMMAPGDQAWAILEQGRFDEGAHPNVGDRETSSLVLVPSAEIGRADSPLVVDDSLPLCSCDADWYEEPPHWEYPSGARP